MHAILMVLDDPNRLDELLEAWEGAGVSGATILESSGMHRRRQQVRGARYAFPFPVLSQGEHEGHYSLLTVVVDDEAVRRCIEAAESVVGPLDGPNSGMLIAWPVPVARGVTGGSATESEGGAAPG